MKITFKVELELSQEYIEYVKKLYSIDLTDPNDKFSCIYLKDKIHIIANRINVTRCK